MSQGDFTNLLTLKGDASGAVRASQEAASALGQVEQAAARTNAMIERARASASRGGSAGINPATGLPMAAPVEAPAPAASDPYGLGVGSRGRAVVMRGGGNIDLATGLPLRQTGEQLDEVARKAERGRQSVRGFAQALGLISPEAAMVARGLHDVQEGMEFLGSAGGLKMAGAVAGIAAVALAVKELADYIREANEAFDKFFAAQRALSKQASQRKTDIAEAAAASGLPPEVNARVGGIQGTLQALGFKPDAAMKAAVASVDEQGTQVFSNEEMILLAAGYQSGQLETEVTGKDLAQRRRNQARLRREVGRESGVLVNQSRQVIGERERQLTEAPDLEELVKEQRPDLEGEKLEELVGAVENAQKRTGVNTPQLSVRNAARAVGASVPALRYLTGATMPGIEEAAQAADIAGQIRAQMEAQERGRTEFGESAARMSGRSVPATQPAFERPSKVTAGSRPAPAKAGTVNNFHGPVSLNWAGQRGERRTEDF